MDGERRKRKTHLPNGLQRLRADLDLHVLIQRLAPKRLILQIREPEPICTPSALQLHFSFSFMTSGERKERSGKRKEQCKMHNVEEWNMQSEA